MRDGEAVQAACPVGFLALAAPVASRLHHRGTSAKHNSALRIQEPHLVHVDHIVIHDDMRQLHDLTRQRGSACQCLGGRRR